VDSFLLVNKDCYFIGFSTFVPHSRNENAGAALPLVLESNKKPHPAAPVMPDEELDAELDRYGARNW